MSDELGQTEGSWYRVVDDGSLEQGDILPNVQILVSVEHTTERGARKIVTDIEEHTVVVMSQSCDLAAADKIESVTVCAVFTLDQYDEGHKLASVAKLNEVIAGKYIHYFMLNKCDLDGHNQGYRIVEFNKHFALPLEDVRKLAETRVPRLRLESPYRERIAQAFGLSYMRIGLPIDIPKLTQADLPQRETRRDTTAG